MNHKTNCVDPAETAQCRLIWIYTGHMQDKGCIHEVKVLTVPKIIMLNLETSLKSQVSDWLKWQLVTISANQMLDI
jgi:hypothetical protein